MASLSLARPAARNFSTSGLHGLRLVSPGFRATSCISTAPRASNIRSHNIQTTHTVDLRSFSTTCHVAQADKKHSSISKRFPESESGQTPQRFREFGLDDRVFVVTGGARGLGLTLAEALVEAGGHVYCLDRLQQPDDTFHATKDKLAQQYEGSLHYRRVDVQDAKDLDKVISEIAAKHSRMDGLVAAAGVQNVQPALEYPPEKISEMLSINFTGVYLSAVSCARQMIKYRTPGSMCLIGSMSGLIANKGFTSSVYNSSKAAVIQLGRSLAMEWGVIKELEGIEDGTIGAGASGGDGILEHLKGKKRGIRVNVLCPGNIMTPMVRKNFEDDPQLRAIWERENMMGRISEPEEYRGAALFMLSDASSFMTGSHLIIDGGYTAWTELNLFTYPPAMLQAF